VSLNGAWSGTGSRFVSPFSPLSIGLAGAAGQFQLSAAELNILQGGGGGPVTIGTASALNGGGNGPLVSDSFTFNAPLTLIANSITINGTITQSLGGLTLLATSDDPAIGPISGAVDLAGGTGILYVEARSAVFSGSTVNGLTGSAAAKQIVLLQPYGAGPYTVDGFAFFSTSARPPIVISLSAINPQTYLGNIQNLVDFTDSSDTASDDSNSGTGDSTKSDDIASFNSLSSNTGTVTHDNPTANKNQIPVIPHVFEQQNVGLSGGTGDDSMLANPPSQ